MSLGLDEEFVWRQPFPGPGLAVRMLGEVTARAPDAAARGRRHRPGRNPQAPGWYRRLWQAFAVLLPVQSVGVMGDERTYEHTVALRAVESQRRHDRRLGARCRTICWRASRRASSTRCKGINRVVYDIS